MGLELVTEARDTKSAGTFILDVLTFQTVSDVLPDAKFRIFFIYAIQAQTARTSK